MGGMRDGAGGSGEGGSPGPFRPGDLIDGRYRIEFELGRGGMAVVYQALEVRPNRLVALKAMRPEYASDLEFRARFERETQAITAVRESHILPMYTTGETPDGVLFMVTELVADGDLHSLLATECQLAAARVADLIGQVAKALDAVYRLKLIVHRDVKPRNILIDRTPGQPEHAYLADFGITKVTWVEREQAGTEQFLGTPAYMAPEQVNRQPVTGRTDQYALACTAFEALTGRVPYLHPEWTATLYAHVHADIPAASQYRPGLPEAVDRVLARGMAKAPGDRYESCGRFADELRKALTGAPRELAPGGSDPTLPGVQRLRPVPAGRPAARFGAAGRPRRHSSRGRALIASAVAVAVLAGAGIGISMALGNGPKAGHGPGTGRSAPPASASVPAAAAVGVPVRLTTPSGDDIELPATFSADGSLVAAVGNHDPNNVYAWNAITRKYIGTLTLSRDISIEGLTFTPDGKALLALDSAGGVYRWNLSAGSHPMILADAQSSAAQDSANAAISGDGSTVAVEDPAGTGADVYNVSTGKHAGFPDPDGAPLVGTNANGQYNSGTAISLDRSGGVLAVGDTRGNLYIWNVRTHAVIRTLRYNPAATLDRNRSLSQGAPAATLSPDGRLAAVADDGVGQKDTLWDIATGANVTPDDTRWPAIWHGAPQVLFCGDGQFIVTEPDNSDGADLWNLPIGAPTAVVSYPDSLLSLGLDVYAASPNGREVLTDDGSRNTFLWKLP
jgi:hypothetical protein